MTTPSREEYAQWGTGHFDSLANSLRTQIEQSTGWANSHLETIRNPGGTEWTGQAADAAEGIADRAVNVTRGRINTAEDLVTIAERGRDSVQGAMSKLNDAVSTAEDAGFEVGSDWSVIPTGTVNASTMNAAVEHAENIQYHLKSLVDTDGAINGELTKKATELDDLKLPRPQGKKDDVFLAGNEFKQGGGPEDQPKPDPVINGPGSKPEPAPNPNHDDLDVTIPNHPDLNIGGDGAASTKDGTPAHHPFLNGTLNPLNVPPGTRAIPTGTADGPNGKKYAFFSFPPYKNADGSDNLNYVTPNSSIVDVTDPAHPQVIGKAPVGQASGAYDPTTNKMYIVGNTGDGMGPHREMYSVPVDANNPNSWASATLPGTPPASTTAPKWTDMGAVMEGNRESQLVRLGGGGFMLTGAEDNGPLRGVTASTPDGLINNTHSQVLVANDPNIGVVGPYGPTIVSDQWDPNTHTDTIQMRVSQFGDAATLPPPGSKVPWQYDPQLFTTTFTVTQP